MAKRPKFEKLGINENYIEDPANEKQPAPEKTGGKVQPEKAEAEQKKASAPKIDVKQKLMSTFKSIFPDEKKKGNFSRFTFRKNIKTTVHTKEEKVKLSPPSTAPFVLLLGVLCMHIIFSAVFSGEAFESKTYADKSIFQVLASLCIYLAPFAAYIATSKKRRIGYYFKPFSPKLLPLAAVALALVVLQSALQKYYIAYTFLYRVPTGIPQGNTGLALLTVALLPAVLEELVIRGVLQYEFTKYGGGITGIIASTAAFCLIHFDLQYLPIYLVSGFILSTLTHITNSVFPAMIVHFVNNAMTVLLSDRLTFVAKEKVGGTFLMIILAALCFVLIMIFLQMTERICRRKASVIHKACSIIKKAEEAAEKEQAENNENTNGSEPVETAENAKSQENQIIPKRISEKEKIAKSHLAYFEKNADMLSLFSPNKDTGKRFISVLFSPIMLACYIIFTIVTVFFA